MQHFATQGIPSVAKRIPYYLAIQELEILVLVLPSTVVWKLLLQELLIKTENVEAEFDLKFPELWDNTVSVTGILELDY